MLSKILFPCLLAASPLAALPSGGQVIQGDAVLFPSQEALRVKANGKAILHWDKFDIASHEAVHFIQSQGKEAILNRVTSGSTSQILGSLHANCPIYLVNPKGIFIGTNAYINTAGFLASTADIADEMFFQEDFRFESFGEGSIVNLGTIHSTHGDVYLIARSIDNQGKIEALNGVATLTTHEMVLHPGTKQCVFIHVDAISSEETGIQNRGTIQALAVELKTRSPYEKAIQHTGCIEAFTTTEKKGRIYLVAEEGGTLVDGSLLSESGEIHILGQNILMEKEARINVSGTEGGSILIGGSYQGQDPQILNAQSTFITQGAEIRADAFEGNAGRIILWSDGITHCEGSLSASAWGSSGDGGFIEVSGLAGFCLSTHPILDSQAGNVGHLLLDPGSLTIQSGGNVAPVFPFATINDGWINAQLAASSLTLCTAGTCSVTAANNAAQTLTVNANVVIAWSSGHDLTLVGQQSVLVNTGASITASSNAPTNGPGSITLLGGTFPAFVAGTTTGITINTATIKTTGTPTIAQPGAITLTGYSGGSGSGSSLSGSTIQATGDINIYGATFGQNGNQFGTQLSTVNISSSSGNVTITGDASKNSSNINAQSTFGFNIAGVANTISASGGNIALIGFGRAPTGTGVSQSPAFNLNAGGTTTITASGNASITATAYVPSVGGINPSDAIRISSTTVMTGSSITLMGTAGPGTGRGMALQNISLQSSGQISLTGIGGGRGGGTFAGAGVFLTTGTAVNSTLSGPNAIQIIGTAPNTIDANTDGVVINGGAQVSTNAGQINIQGSSATPASGGIGILIDGSGTLVTTSNGSIQMTGTGGSGSANRGILIQNASKVTSTGSGTISLNGTGGAGASDCAGIYITGSNSTISSTNSGSITLTGLSQGTGTDANGINLLAAGSITSTGSGNIFLIGTSSSSATANSSSGILISGTSSSLITTSSNIHLTATGQGGGVNNIGLNLTSAGKISSTSGSITGTCLGGTGISGCAGIVISSSGSLISSATGGGINLTGTGQGTTTSNQGISITSAGEIQTTNNAPITLTGTGSTSGTSSNEGIFMTGVSTTVSTATGAILMTGTAGGSTFNGITVDSGAKVLCSTSGLVTLNASNNNVAVQNNSSVTTSGVSGPGINDISITSNGLSITGGILGKALISTVNGNIAVTSTGSTTLTGSSALNSFAQMTVGSATNTVTIQSAGIQMAGGTASGAFAEISTLGGLITIDGVGPISLTGGISGTGDNTQAQIITKTNAGAGINIGLNASPTILTLQGGSDPILSRAVIATDVSGSIACTISGNYSITGGTSNGAITDDARAGFYTDLSGSVGGSGSITLQGAGYSLTGGASGIGKNSAEILTPVDGGTITLNAGGGALALVGQGATASDARIATQAAGNAIAINTISSFSATGGNGALSRAIVATDQGGDITITGTGNFTIQGGTSAGDSRAGVYSGLSGGSGSINLTGAGYSLTGGASGAGYNSAEILAPAGGGTITLTSNVGSMTLLAQNAATSDARIATQAAGNAIAINTISSFSATGGNGALSRAIVATDLGGSINISGNGTYTITGGSSPGDSRAGIYTGVSGGSGDITLSGSGYNLTGGSSTGTNRAEIASAPGGGSISLTSISGTSTLQGGSGTATDARIITNGTGNISITATNDLSLLGGSGTSSVADINATGSVTSNIGVGNYILSGGASGSSLARVTAIGTVNLTGSNYTLTAGSSGTADNSNALIESTGANTSMILAANNAGVITLNGGTAADQHSYIQTTALAGANPVTLTCTVLNLNGSATNNGSAEVRTVLGDVGVTAFGNVNITGGSSAGANALIQSTAQGSLTLAALNLNVQGGSAGLSGLTTSSGDIQVTCAQNCVYAAPTAGALAVMQTFGSDLTVNSGGSINLSGFTIYSTPAPTGNILLIAGQDITLGTNVQVVANGTIDSSVTLVVDNAFPAAPNVGLGQFVIDAGATLSSGGGLSPLLIYTARRPQNTINAPLNGAVFVPGPFAVDTTTEQWGTYYAGGTYGVTPFKIYYKEPQAVPPPPNPIPSGPSEPPRRFFENIDANLVQLAQLLPLLEAPICPLSFPSYHFQLCTENEGESFYCDPTFSPYGSFIFEDDLYWIGDSF
jgi:filamentous hemagglutinin family protein